MHKVVILIEPLENWDRFEELWPEFLHRAEAMPGLLREATSRVEATLYGRSSYVQMHELFFESRARAEAALASPQGQLAGKLLQVITGGSMVLLFAEYQEDDLANIQKYRKADDDAAAAR
ncbi:MAG: EthD family reductase [Chloroflexota bacterium]